MLGFSQANKFVHAFFAKPACHSDSFEHLSHDQHVIRTASSICRMTNLLAHFKQASTHA